MTEHARLPKVRLAEMRQYRASNGKMYLTGYLGRVKLLLFRDDSAECSGNEVAKWSLFIEETPPRDKDGAGQKTSKPAAPSGQDDLGL